MKNQTIVSLWAFIILLVSPLTVVAQSTPTFIGVWRSGNVKQKAFPESNNPNHIKQVAKDEGYNCITDIEIYVKKTKAATAGKELSAFVYEKAPSACIDRIGNWNQFVQDWKDLAKQGYRLKEIESYYQPINKERWYYGVFHKDNYGYYLWKVDGWTNFVRKWKELAKKNLRLVDIETYAQGGKRYYLGVWRAGTQGYHLHNLEGWGNFTKKWEQLGKNNYRLIDLESYVHHGKRYYVGIWLYGGGGYYLWRVKGWPNFTKKFWELRKKNFKLIDLEIIH